MQIPTVKIRFSLVEISSSGSVCFLIILRDMSQSCQYSISKKLFTSRSSSWFDYWNKYVYSVSHFRRMGKDEWCSLFLCPKTIFLPHSHISATFNIFKRGHAGAGHKIHWFILNFTHLNIHWLCSYFNVTKVTNTLLNHWRLWFRKDWICLRSLGYRIVFPFMNFWDQISINRHYMFAFRATASKKQS